jgi:hypothetical protein
MNNYDGIDDYFNSQAKSPFGHEKPDWVEPITYTKAKFYQKGMAHGAELERERIIELLDNNLGNINLDDLIKLIREENNG